MLRRQRRHDTAPAVCRAVIETLEERKLLSGGNALDTIQFGSASSESAHAFDSGLMTLPPQGTGAAGLTYREIAGPASGTSTGANNEVLTFTMGVDSFKQNYLTIRLWGSDTTPGVIYLYNPVKGYGIDAYDQSSIPWLDWQVSGAQPAFPGRFYYETTPIPLSWTQGQTSVSLTLDAASDDQRYNNHTTIQLTSGQVTRPIYNAFTTTDPNFTPDSSDPTGTAPSSTSRTLGTITAAQAQTILLNERKSNFGSGGYYNAVVARQIPATVGAPAEVVGLDSFSTPSSLSSDTAAQWDAQVGNSSQGPGYTALPDELISLLSTSYLLQPLSGDSTDPNYYHSTAVLQNIVAAFDGSTYMQGSDGGFANGSGWVGITAAGGKRTPVGSSGSLQGIDCQVLGDTLLSLLSDPALPSGTNLQTYLGQYYDANLNGGSMLRAYAYERMLFNNLNFLRSYPGGTSSQNLFQITGAYADQIGLEKLQALYPNPAYPALPVSIGLNMAEQVVGTAPTTFRGGYNGHYAVSPNGLGKDGNPGLEGGYDRGYGQWFPELSLQIAKLAQQDPAVSTAADQAAVTRIETQARDTVVAYDQFLSTNLSATTSNGTTTYSQIINPDDTISTRNEENPDNLPFDVNTQFAAANPGNSSLYTPLASRSTYLLIQNGLTPEPFFDNQTPNSNLQYLREIPDYEASINSLVNNTPAPLPGETPDSNFASADVSAGTVAFQNNGERVYMSLNYRGPTAGVDNIVRIHDTSATADRIAEVYMASSGATEQSDGNLTGNFAQPWVVRYGSYLVVLNRSSQSDTINLPLGLGNATNLLTGNSYAMGSTFSVAAGQASIIYLGNAKVSSAAALQQSPPTSSVITSLVAGYSTATLANSQSLVLLAAAFDSNGLPLTTLPTLTWTLQSGVGSIDSTGLYVAPQTGAGTATIVASAGGVTSSPITLTIVPLPNNGNDIGTVGVAGSDSYTGGTYTAAGAGAGLAGTADAFHYVSQPVTGDVIITAKATSASATAGVMLRGSAASNAAFAAAVYVPGSSGVQFVYRTTAGGTVTKSTVIPASSGVYLQITRGTGPDGTTYTGAYSANGTIWTNITTSKTIAISAIAAQAFGGVFVTSGSTVGTGTATFINVAFTRASNEYPTISALTTGVHGSNVWYQFNVTDAYNSGNHTLTVTDRVAQQPANAAVYSFSGTNFYPTTAGTYVIQVNVTNGDGLYVSQNVTLNVTQVLSGVSFAPSSPIVLAGASQSLSAIGTDQFGNSMAVANPTWSVASGGGTISSAGVYSATSTPGVYAITVTSGSITGTSNADVVLAPTMQASVNNGAAQRSMVTSVTLVFSHAVTLGSNAVTIALHPSSADGSTAGALPTLSWSSADGGISWIVSFSGSGVVNGSIADGIYDITVNAQQVEDSSLQSLSGNVMTTFYRLFGDYDGNGTVNNADYARFRAAYGSSSGDGSYLDLFDYDGNGTINNYDYAQFRNRYGSSFTL